MLFLSYLPHGFLSFWIMLFLSYFPHGFLSCWIMVFLSYLPHGFLSFWIMLFLSYLPGGFLSSPIIIFAPTWGIYFCLYIVQNFFKEIIRLVGFPHFYKNYMEYIFPRIWRRHILKTMAIFFIFYGILDDYIEKMLAILNFYSMVEIQTMLLFLSRFFI